MSNKIQLADLVIRLRRSLPAQAPLKDFIATNTLYAFQGLPFHRGLSEAQRIFGIKAYLETSEYLNMVQSGNIKKEVLDWVISQKSSEGATQEKSRKKRIRDFWKKKYEIDMVTHVHPVFFRHLGHFLDQGISFSPFPFSEVGFWGGLQELERQSAISIFKTGKKGQPHSLLQKSANEACLEALQRLVGREELFEAYLFEMLQEHPGWSGLVAVVEDNPKHLNFPRKITLIEAIAFELLLELDYVETFLRKTKSAWAPLSVFQKEFTEDSNNSSEDSKKESNRIDLLHEALEWSYYQELFTGLRANPRQTFQQTKDAQVFFCIDDRCCSLRRHLEEGNPQIETFGTPGFFGVEFWYQTESDRFPVKLCPAPLNPEFLIRGARESGAKLKPQTDFLLSRLTHTLFGGWIVSQTFGLLSALRMLLNIFSPTLSPKVAASFRHTDDQISFKLLRENDTETLNGLKLGYTKSEMADRVFSLLRSCGLVESFSDLVVMLGHGSSTVNNPHYAAYDCGACSGRPGSINARLFCLMANDREVRELVKKKGLDIPEITLFVPGLYDTTRDQVYFYDLKGVRGPHLKQIDSLKQDLERALIKTAKERARRFDDIPLDASLHEARKRLRRKSVSIFEPRQEFTHSGNAACIIGPRAMTRGLFLDRRSFLNSYDPKLDPKGDILCNLLRAAVPVCGGINLQYFFSRVDNEKLGSGTKLPHNVVGLFSVANGTEGDLRPGLPQQMVEWHQPLRLMLLVYQEPSLALEAAKRIPATFEWIQNEWVRFACISPSSGEFFVFQSGEMKLFDFFGPNPPKARNSLELISKSRDYLPVTLLGGEK